MSAETQKCVRCGKPVIVNADRYSVYEGMHWICFHFEFEHKGDPDAPCDCPDCPVGQLEIFRQALTEAGQDPNQLVFERRGQIRSHDA